MGLRRAVRASIATALLAGAAWARADERATPSNTSRTESNIAPALSAALAADALPSWTIVLKGRDPIVAVVATIRSEVPLAAAAGMLSKHRAAVRSFLNSTHALVLELPQTQIQALAGEEGVAWLESPLPRLTPTNLENRARVGAEVLQSAGSALDGAGVNVLVYDAGAASLAHPDLSDHLTLLDGAAFAGHATHVAGTVAGSGASSFGTQRGLAPGAHLLSAGASFNSTQSVILYDDPGDLEADFSAALIHPQFPGDLVNMSLGSNIESNFYPCSIQGNYGATDRLLDAIARGALGRTLPIVLAGGNERQTSRCDVEGFGDYYSVAPPAGAKNPLAVGAVNVDDETMTTFSSWGPTDDGRLKPDFVAPGCQTAGDGGVTSCALYGGYEVRCGTSMAAPTVAGLCALLLEEYRRQFPAQPAPRGATYKALLAQTAADLGNPGPDFRFGYGSVRGGPAIEVLQQRRFAEAQLETGAAWTARVFVALGDAQLKLTLAWDDPPAPPGAAPQLVNDLDLVVTGPGAIRYFPWTLDPQNPDAPAARTQPDRRNNIEQVAIDAPPPGEYTIQVAAFQMPQPPQTFSIVSSTPIAVCTARGVLSVDPGPLRCDTSVQIEVSDCDLNSDSAAIETTTVQAASTSDPVSRDVVLTETAPSSGVFHASLQLAPLASPAALLVTDGDAVTITYLDANDGAGHTAVATSATVAIDCTPPVISNVRVGETGAAGAAILFETNEAAAAEVTYDPTCSNTVARAAAPGRHFAHRVLIPNLSASTVYQYRPAAVDAAGNRAALAAPGGACFTFRTAAAPDYFTEIFQSDDNDLNSKSVLFAPNGSNNYYEACRANIGALPTNPVGGAVLALADDGSAMISPGGGPLLLYGVAYDAVWVNANGTLTFDGPDADYHESTFTHFARPAVAALWDNFNPAAEGAVSWKETADRIAVTWENVADVALSSNSTFQIELFFDGRIRISWLEIGILDGLTGLSRGGGRPADFIESNMTGYAPCGTRPPGASDLRCTIPTGAAVTIALPAAGSAALTYSVLSAPAGELRDAVTNQTIGAAALPFTLADGGNRLLYFSAAPRSGDSFRFRASDGGAPPAGGESNDALVELTTQSPLSPPIFEPFELAEFDAALWDSVVGATIDAQALAPPSPPLAARLNGAPRGGDVLTTRMIDLRGYLSATVSYAYQRRGGGESPESGDDLIVSYRAANGRWQELARQPGYGPDMTTFAHSVVPLPPNALHRGLRLRFQSAANEAAAVDDWFVDDLQIAGVARPVVAGDVDCDGVLTNFDVDPFVLALVDPAGYAAAFPQCDARRADFDGDGALTNFDVDPFVTCLVNLGCP